MLKNCKWRLFLLALLFLFPGTTGWTAPAFMPVDEVKAGMHGVARTVVSGTKIEEFGVEVLGVMKDKGPSGDLILVRTYGDLIEKSGGIAQGMSGSPVYIDGRLVGAIAYGWSLTDHRTGMITPIADMLKLFELPQAADTAALPAAAAAPTAPEPPAATEPPAAAEPPATEQPPAAPQPDEPVQPLATPLMVSGFSDRALKMLGEQLQPFNLVPYASGEPAGGVAYGPIEPGSSVGVQLVQGDVSIGALGTVTYVDGDKLLAFGHPFLKKGLVGYYLSNAYIFTAMQGIENSFKLGITGDSIGTVYQDRGAGVAAVLDRFPANIPVRVHISDQSTGRSRDAFFRAVHDEQLGPVLSAVGVYNLVDKTIDRVGSGTAKVRFELSAKDMPGGGLQRENMFYSPAGIAEATVAELHEALALLAGNQFHPVDVIDVKVDIEMTEERRTAYIMEAKAGSAAVRPGDTVRIITRLKPYRGQPVVQNVDFTVPKDQPAGPMTLSVRGGGMVPLLQLLLKKDLEDLVRPEKNRQKAFDTLVKDFTERDRNNDLVVEVMAMGEEEFLADSDTAAKPASALGGEPKPTPKRAAKASSVNAAAISPLPKTAAPKVKSHRSTDYIIEGDTRVVLNILPAQP